MTLAILSDIHANLEALRATLDDIAAVGADEILCLGDIVGYNTNPAECIALLREARAICIAGNHDRAVTGQIPTDGFNPIAARAVAWTRRQLSDDMIAFLGGLPLKAVVPIDGTGAAVAAVHGALHPETGCELVRLDNDERRRLSFEALRTHPSGARLCAFGHTHRAGIFEWRDDAVQGGSVQAMEGDEVRLRPDGYYLVNPGTVGQPRTADRRASYLILDPARRVMMLRRVPYRASATLAKTRRAGLAPRFSRIPEPIRTPLRNLYRSIVR